MADADHDRRRDVAFEKLARVMEGVGFPHAISRVFTALTLAPGEGLSTSELVEQLGMSRASVSNATQFLVGTELAERYRVPGSREMHYRILKGSWGPILGKKFAVMSSITATVRNAMEYAESEAALERLREMEDVYSFFEEEFAEMMNRWNERNKR